MICRRPQLASPTTVPDEMTASEIGKSRTDGVVLIFCVNRGRTEGSPFCVLGSAEELPRIVTPGLEVRKVNCTRVEKRSTLDKAAENVPSLPGFPADART